MFAASASAMDSVNLDPQTPAAGSYASSIGFDDNFKSSKCYIGILDIPKKKRLSQQYLEYDDQYIVHLGWDEFKSNSSAVCPCKNLYIRITKTQGTMPIQILRAATDAIFVFAAWYPTTRQRTIYVRFDGSIPIKKSDFVKANKTKDPDLFTVNVIQSMII